MNFPEDIVNQMSSLELENCDWDSLFQQIEHLYLIGTQSMNKMQSNAYREHTMGFDTILDSKKKLDTRVDIGSTVVMNIANNEPSLEQKLFSSSSIRSSANDLDHRVNPEMDHTYRNNIAHKSQLQTFPYYQWGLFEKAYLSPLSSPCGETKRTLRSAKFNCMNGFGKTEIVIRNSQISDDDLDGDDLQQKKTAYSCKICKEVYQTRSSLVTHVKVHQQPFCKKCLSFFKTISNLRTHNRKFHLQNEPFDESDINNNSSDNDDDKKNYLDKYNNISMKTVTSKYGRRRKVIDMSEMTMIKKPRKTF